MKNKIIKIEGNLVDIHKRSVYPAQIIIKGERIQSVKSIDTSPNVFIMPGLIDSHIHIESSMLTPGAFAVASVPHGTIGVVADPHEIANVLGIKGVYYMIDDAKKTQVKFWFGAPSCVPATNYESSGSTLNKENIKELMDMPEITHLAEMMNYPGVIFKEKKILQKIKIAKKAGKPIDGHAPGLKGEELKKYIETGISTDHECSTIEEAKEKLSLGMKIIIREGSAARNLDTLKTLFKTDPENLMLCSDDLHPEMLKKRHINKLVAKLISEGYDKFNVIRSTSLNPVEHYNLDAGLLRPGDKADFILVRNLEKMDVLETWINGKKVYDNGRIMFRYKPGESVNNFNCSEISEKEIQVTNKKKNYRVINAYDGELLTKEIISKSVQGKWLESIQENDILKIIVKDRYKNAKPAIGFIKGFGIKKGAFASSIAHDSHNIIAIGTNDAEIITAVNEIVKHKGGLAVAVDGKVNSLQLNIAGIMSDKPCRAVASKYEILSEMVKNLGCRMAAPFMTLSFMALLVIPELKISDMGLFDGNKFCHVPLFVD